MYSCELNYFFTPLVERSERRIVTYEGKAIYFPHINCVISVRRLQSNIKDVAAITKHSC